MKRWVRLDGNEIGTYDPNPMTNSLIYWVEYPDDEIREYMAIKRLLRLFTLKWMNMATVYRHLIL